MKHFMMMRFVLVMLVCVCSFSCQAASSGSVLPKQAADGERWLLAADGSTRRIALIDGQGQTVWEREVQQIHDLHLLDNGNILYQDSFTHLVEVDPKKDEIVWTYDATKKNRKGDERVEIHAFQRLDNGDTMIAESGATRIIEVNQAGEITHELAMQVTRPDAHRDTRLVRKTKAGTYLVAHEGEGKISEYDAQGEVVWSYDVPLFDRERAGGHGLEAFGNQAFAAVRLDSGNTLIATGNGHSVIEVTPGGEVVWALHQNDLEGIRLAWVTTLQVQANGNLVIGNCHAGEGNPQIVEINRDKQVVWTFKDFDRFGDALSNSQLIHVGQGESIR